MFKNYNSGFSKYDPSMSKFDPSLSNRANGADDAGAYTTATAKPGQKMQINVTLTNNTLVKQTVELFQWLYSWTKVRKPEYIPSDPNYAMYPMLSYEGLVRTNSNAGGTVGFNADGDLIVRGDDSGMVDDPLVTVGCSEIGYISLFEATSITPFTVAYLRQTVTTSNQIDQVITWFKKTIAGGEEQNKISPRAYFRPNQFQNLTIDITVSFDINIDSGLRLPLLAGESVTLALFISNWTNQVLG